MHPMFLFTLLMVGSAACFVSAQQTLRSRIWRKLTPILLLIGLFMWIVSLCILISAMERRALVQSLDELSKYETQN